MENFSKDSFKKLFEINKQHRKKFKMYLLNNLTSKCLLFRELNL